MKIKTTDIDTTGTAGSSTFLRGDGEWAVPPGTATGTVTSVGVSAPTGLEVSGSPVTTSGTIAISYGTGFQGYTSAEASKVAALASMSTQDNASVNITGGTIVNVSTVRVANTAAGSSVGGLRVIQTDSAASVTHTSLFYTEQMGGGLGRTLFYAASPTTDATAGQFDIITENGSKYLARIGRSGPGGTNVFDVHATDGSLKTRFSTDGLSYLKGGPLAIFGSTPASSSAAGEAGTVTWDGDYIYVCTATNTWKRAALSTW